MEGFKNSLPDSIIENASIGASPGIQFASALDQDFSVYDYVIFDSVPNDEEYQYKCRGYSHIDFSTRVIFDICSTIAAQTRLIVLGISTKDHLYKESAVYSNRRKIAQSCGSQFLDIRALIIKNSETLIQATHASDLYDPHPAHPLPAIMRTVGEAFGESLKYFKFDRIGHSTSYKQKYLTIDAAKLSGVAVTNKRTSIVAEDFAELFEHDTVEFNADLPCIGFYLNHSATNALVEAIGTDASYKINLANHRLTERLLKVFVAVPNGAQMKKLKISAPLHYSEDIHNPLIFSKTSTSRDAQLQISRIVFLTQPIGSFTPSLSESTSYNLLEKEIQQRINNIRVTTENRARESNIRNAFGQYIFFNARLNRCISLDSRFVSSNSKELYPIVVQETNDKCQVYACIKNSLFLLSFFSDSISINESRILKLVKPTGTILSSTATIECNSDGSFSLLCLGFYVFSAPNHSLACNRKKALRCERFFFE